MGFRGAENRDKGVCTNWFREDLLALADPVQNFGGYFVLGLGFRTG